MIDRKWSDGDKVELNLPMKIKLRKWAQNNNSVSVDRGPLTYSLKIGEKYVREGGTDEWPAWEIHPTTPWNYGLVLNEGEPASSFSLVRKAWPDNNQPFEGDAAPLELRARAKKIGAWQKDHLGLVGKLQPSPARAPTSGKSRRNRCPQPHHTAGKVTASRHLATNRCREARTFRAFSA